MNEKTTGKASAHTPAVPEVLGDPLRNRGAAFTERERDALGLTRRLSSEVLTLKQAALAKSVRATVRPGRRPSGADLRRHSRPPAKRGQSGTPAKDDV